MTATYIFLPLGFVCPEEEEEGMFTAVLVYFYRFERKEERINGICQSLKKWLYVLNQL
jgi:hypothetical protein